MFIIYLHRAIGQKCLAQHMELQRSNIIKFIHTIKLSPTTDDSSQGNNSNSNVNNDKGAVATIKHLDEVKAQWLNVLPDNLYERMIGYLIECMIRCVVQPVQETDCISVTAATDIGRINRILLTAQYAFIDTTEENLNAMVPSWNKFNVLTELLDFSISEVTEWLPRKKFSSFTPQELGALIKALFEDSERRQNILNLILEMSN